MYSNQVYIMLQLLNYSKTIQKHIDIKDINVSMINHSYIKNTIASLHKYMIHINRVFKVYYLQYSTLSEKVIKNVRVTIF